MSIKFGEYLFELKSEIVLDTLKAITAEDIRDCSGFREYQRGREYYEEGMVESVYFHT